MPMRGPAGGLPEISVVIPTFERAALLARVLDRLDDQRSAAGRFEVIVVADSRHRGIDRLDRLTARRRYPVHRLTAHRPGASAARNAGWRAAQAPLLLFIDDDILPERRLVAEHLLWHRLHPAAEIGVLGHVRWAAEVRVTAFMRWLERGVQFDYSAISGTEAHWGNFYTANVSVKRTLVERTGGFDEEHLPFGYEDLDLALRMHREAGFRLLYNRAAAAEHVHPMDLDFWKRRVRRIAVAERQFVALHPEIAPYFHDLFVAAASAAPASPVGPMLARVVPPSTPILGRRVWSKVDAFYRQALAPPFLEAWTASEASSPPGFSPHLNEAMPESPPA